MKFNKLCDLEASKIIEESIIKEEYGQYKIKIQFLDSNDGVVDEMVHEISGDEAAWDRYQQIHKLFQYNESLTNNEQIICENLVKIFGNLGQEIKDYFLCKRNADFKKQYTLLGQQCPTSHELFSKIKFWVNNEKNNPELKTIVAGIMRIKEMSNDLDEFLANLSQEFLYNYKKYEQNNI